MKTAFAAAPLLVLALLALPAAGAGKVTEAKLGTQIVDRAVSGETATFATGAVAYYWFRVEGAAGELLTVTWKVNDLAFPVELAVQGSPWRTWASKTLHIAGAWTVTVTDGSGAALHEARFTVQ